MKTRTSLRGWFFVLPSPVAWVGVVSTAPAPARLGRSPPELLAFFQNARAHNAAVSLSLAKAGSADSTPPRRSIKTSFASTVIDPPLFCGIKDKVRVARRRSRHCLKRWIQRGTRDEGAKRAELRSALPNKSGVSKEEGLGVLRGAYPKQRGDRRS